MQACGIVTLTTDFGHQGPFVGVMKGVILGRYAAARIVDLTHEIPAQWPPEAGFWVGRAYRWFPPGAVHVAVVDPGVGTERDILIVERDGHCFLAPDNGLLAPLIDGRGDVQVYKLDPAALPGLGIDEPSMTFHGRDVFAPVAAELAAGRAQPASLGTATSDWAPPWLDEPEVSADRIAGVVVAIDSFGNLISNIDRALLGGREAPTVRIAGRDVTLMETYGRAHPGDYLALINSFGVLEIARAEGDAAASLGVERGAPITVSWPGPRSSTRNRAT